MRVLVFHGQLWEGAQPWSASAQQHQQAVFCEINMATFLSAKYQEDFQESTFANTLGPTWGTREKCTLCLRLASSASSGPLALGV